MSNDPFFEDVAATVRKRAKGVCEDKTCGKKWSTRKNAIGVSPAQTQTAVIRRDRFGPDSPGNNMLVCKRHKPHWEA